MKQLTDYVLAVRSVGSAPVPAGVKTVDLGPYDPADPVGSVLDGLRASGLKAVDFRASVVYVAPAGPAALVEYAALCGFAGRRLDAFAEGTVMEFSRLSPSGEAFKDAGRPGEFLKWAQVGGPAAEGIPTVQLGAGAQGVLVSPEAASVIRYAARLRMVPPASTRDALAAFMLVAAVRRRTDDRFPFLSSGTEPTPAAKDDPNQGIDLELVRREAAKYRQELRADRARAEVVPPVPVSPRNQRIVEANKSDIKDLLRRLGSSAAEDTGLWRCPRPRNHSNGDQNPSMKVYGRNRTRCQRCDAEKIGPVRLVVETLRLSPDEAAAFILDSTRVVDMRHAA